ncbi:MAG: hypothetical protein KA714_19710 [Limnoraphis sp. WC205]|nr:hypothetical protein [Limnoraphis sp. WC205]
MLPFLQQPAYPSRHQAEYRYGVGLPAKKAKTSFMVRGLLPPQTPPKS